jgi:hypothetical protein
MHAATIPLPAMFKCDEKEKEKEGIVNCFDDLNDQMHDSDVTIDK